MDQSDCAILGESEVAGHTSQGLEVCGVPVRLHPHRVVFELYDVQTALRTSEVLADFKLVVRGQTLYSGRAVIAGLLNTGVALLCEASVEEAWLAPVHAAGAADPSRLAEDFRQFMGQWQKLYIVRPEYKIAIADLQSFLMDLRLWLEPMEARLQALPEAHRRDARLEILEKLTPSTTPAITALFEKYEVVARKVGKDQMPAHQVFGRRQVHPLILTSPFVHRTFRKPLGYAGDYEMVNMLMRSPYEGDSLFAGVVNVYALGLPPIVAHRNRLAYLRRKLAEEARRSLIQGHPARFLSVGCGPAWELQSFLREDDFADKVEITLLDFNQETLDHASAALAGCRKSNGRLPSIRTQKQSVQQILRRAIRADRQPEAARYDFVYCAGLFDYLPDAVCKSLISHYYGLLAPGGLFVATNVDDHPSRNEMECFLDWHLIYRDARQMRALAPPDLPREQVLVLCEDAGVNLFLELRRPSCER